MASIDTLETFQPPLRLQAVPRRARERFSWAVHALTILVLAFGTVYLQEQKLTLHYVETYQLARHQAVLNGTSPNPWAYRVLSEYVAEGFIRAAAVAHVPHAVAVGFLLLRVVQNAFLFAFALMFYRLLGLTARESYIGMVLLSYAMTYSLYNSDLSFNTYADILFYFVAGCVVLAEWPLWWLLPIGFLAALNRETSLFIAFFPVAALVGNWGRNWRSYVPRISMAVACLVVQVVTLKFLRVMIHPAALPWNQVWHNQQGWPTLHMNLTSPFTLTQLGLTLSVLPIAALWNFRGLPAWLRGLFWIMIPAWFAVHFLMVYANETRIFLVPAALVLIPAALYPRDRLPAANVR